MNSTFDFTKISMNGRIAYSIMCAEKYAITKYPNRDWKPLFVWMWKATSENFDEWYYRFSEILPEYLFEFDNYHDAEFDYLTEDQYVFYSELLKGIDDKFEKLLKVTTDISMVYCYTEIPGYGKESIDLVEKSIDILTSEEIDLPNPEKVSFSQFCERNGWGEKFDGQAFSIIQ